MKSLINISIISLLIFSCDNENPMIPIDECGVPNGDNTSCIDECGVVNGNNYTDEICGSCSVNLWGECYGIEETTSLNLGSSGLTGEIPSEIGNLTNLESLILSSNQLTGEIPSEIGNLTNLTSLSLGYNQLTGEIPSEIGNLTNLTYLRLSSNELTGEIPSEICNLVDSFILVKINKLCPPYPDCISQEDIDSQDTSDCP